MSHKDVQITCKLIFLDFLSDKLDYGPYIFCARKTVFMFSPQFCMNVGVSEEYQFVDAYLRTRGTKRV
jgi:hypothetical protein